jgi:hypothetical protein
MKPYTVNGKGGWKIVINNGIPDHIFNELVESWNERKPINPKCPFTEEEDEE